MTDKMLDNATLQHAASIAAALVRSGDAGEIEETILRLAASQPAQPQASREALRDPVRRNDFAPGEEGDAHFAAYKASLKSPHPAGELAEFVPSDAQRLDWLDQHCAFVADSQYCIGPYKIGELRKMADDGIAHDAIKNSTPLTPAGEGEK